MEVFETCVTYLQLAAKPDLNLWKITQHKHANDFLEKEDIHRMVLTARLPDIKILHLRHTMFAS